MTRNKFRNPPVIDDKLGNIHILILLNIKKDPTINLTQLSKNVKRTPQTVSYHTHRLQDSDYIIIKTDGINNFFTLTEKGEKFLRSIGENLERIYIPLFNELKRFPLYINRSKLPPKEKWEEVKYLMWS